MCNNIFLILTSFIALNIIILVEANLHQIILKAASCPFQQIRRQHLTHCWLFKHVSQSDSTQFTYSCKPQAFSTDRKYVKAGNGLMIPTIHPYPCATTTFIRYLKCGRSRRLLTRWKYHTLPPGNIINTPQYTPAAFTQALSLSHCAGLNRTRPPEHSVSDVYMSVLF